MDGSLGSLVGRDLELSLFDGLVAGVLGGRGGVVWVEGEPGIGKSALVGAVVGRASGAGCVTLVGRGDEAGQVFPLRLMSDCLHGVAAAGGSESGAAGSVLSSRLELFDPNAADPVWAAGERMLAVVDRLCAARPVVLVAEDLQWADEWSLGLWTRLARSVDQIPLLLVGTSRPLAEHTELARARLAVEDRGGATIDLRPLSGGEVAAMGARLAGGVPGPGLVAALAQAGGNPLYVRELVGALVADGLVRVQAGAAELVAAAGPLPESLVASIGRRLSFLSPVTYRALHMAALLAAEFSAGQWATVADLSPGQLAEIVDEALTGGVLVSGAGRLMFRHELIRQVLTQRTPETVRVELHRDMARLLAAAGYGVDVVAAHLVAAPGMDEWARAWLADRSQELVFSAPEVSADLLDRAVGLLDEDDPLWEVLAARLAETLYRLGRDEAAGQMAEAVVAATHDGEVAGRMWVQSIRVAGRTGQFEQAVARGQEAVVDQRLPAHWRARSLAWLATSLLHLARGEQAQAQALQALDEATRCGDMLGGAYARYVLYLTDRATQAFRLDEALASLGDDPESQDLRIVLLSLQLGDLGDRGKWDDYDTMLARSLVAADQVGALRATVIPGRAVGFHYVRGDWDEALRHVAAIAPEYLDKLKPSWPRVLAATIGLRREDSDLVAEHMGGANALTNDIHAASAFDLMAWSGVLAWKAEAAADLDQALAWHKLLLDQPPHLRGAAPQLMPDLVRVALQVGDTATATAAADACQETAEATAKEFHILIARVCQAQLANDADALLAVAERLHAYGAAPLAALASEEAASRLARDGAHVAARTALHTAVRIYADLGATLDIRRADTRLRALGVRRGSRSLHRRATHGWDSLTPTQQRIADLVAKGLSNPDIAAHLFVSRNTVQSHVSTILTKLDIHSRVELILHQTNQTTAN